MSLFSSIGGGSFKDILPPERKDLYFPVDCIGVILEFCTDSSIVNRFLQTCYHVRKYVEQNVNSCVNISFKFKKTPKLVKPYVINLHFHEVRTRKGFLLRFPNIKSLRIVKMNKITNSELEFRYLEKLEIESCKKIDNPPFNLIKKLRILKIDNSHFGYMNPTKLKTENFKYLDNLETLELCNVKLDKFDDNDFSSMKKLKKLSITESGDFLSSIFVHLKHLEILKIERMFIEMNGFVHLKKVKDLTIRRASNVTSKESVVEKLGRTPEIFCFEADWARKGYVALPYEN